jgi:hypothetical protein
MIAAVYLRKSTEQTGVADDQKFVARLDHARQYATRKPRAPFQVLIMSEISRLGREQIETAYALKQTLSRRGALFQLSGRSRTPHGKRDG